MKPGDIIYQAIDSISSNGSLSVFTVKAVEAIDAMGNKVLMPGPKHRSCISPGDFRYDPSDEFSEIDMEKFKARVKEIVESALGDPATLAAEKVAHLETINFLREENKKLKDKLKDEKGGVI